MLPRSPKKAPNTLGAIRIPTPIAINVSNLLIEAPYMRNLDNDDDDIFIQVKMPQPHTNAMSDREFTPSS
ncbi:hypothetical protein V9T40_002286 [Parthenolecanium corni]|uniref:Uncharacterized protein n=1 Tax=Parthenolecanium corni TaxID=536013 RepID=A0AAN9Y5G5_9HEMI